MVKLRLILKLILCAPGTDLIFALWMEGKFYFLLQMSLGGWVVDSGDTNARGALFQRRLCFMICLFLQKPVHGPFCAAFKLGLKGLIGPFHAQLGENLTKMVKKGQNQAAKNIFKMIIGSKKSQNSCGKQKAGS